MQGKMWGLVAVDLLREEKYQQAHIDRKPIILSRGSYSDKAKGGEEI
jgi:hypothetical protein